MQPPSAPNLFKILADPHEPLVDQPPVGFLNLGFTGTTQEAEAATLAFKRASRTERAEIADVANARVRPGASPSLVRHARSPKMSRIKAGAVDDHSAPRPFQLALLHRRHGGIDDHHLYMLFWDIACRWFSTSGLHRTASEKAAGRAEGRMTSHTTT